MSPHWQQFTAVYNWFGEKEFWQKTVYTSSLCLKFARSALICTFESSCLLSTPKKLIPVKLLFVVNTPSFLSSAHLHLALYRVRKRVCNLYHFIMWGNSESLVRNGSLKKTLVWIFSFFNSDLVWLLINWHTGDEGSRLKRLSIQLFWNCPLCSPLSPSQQPSHSLTTNTASHPHPKLTARIPPYAACSHTLLLTGYHHFQHTRSTHFLLSPFACSGFWDILCVTFSFFKDFSFFFCLFFIIFLPFLKC